MRQRFEKPQRSNPHQLRIKQHVWPLKSITRFCDAAGNVRLFDKVRNKERRASPDDHIFLAKRVWDQRAEAGYMKKIEDAFQNLADEIIADTVSTIVDEQKTIIDAFFALWRMRADHKGADTDPISLKGVTGTNWTKDQEEKFEKAGIAFLREDGTMPARVLHGLRIQRGIDDYTCQLSNIRWVIIRIQEGHLIVPDYPIHTIIPITPTLFLCSGGEDGTITRTNVAEINRSFRLGSHEYFFAHDLMRCP